MEHIKVDREIGRTLCAKCKRVFVSNPDSNSHPIKIRYDLADAFFQVAYTFIREENYYNLFVFEHHKIAQYSERLFVWQATSNVLLFFKFVVGYLPFVISF